MGPRRCKTLYETVASAKDTLNFRSPARTRLGVGGTVECRKGPNESSLSSPLLPSFLAPPATCHRRPETDRDPLTDAFDDAAALTVAAGGNI